MNDVVEAGSEWEVPVAYDANRYDDWSFDQIVAALRGSTLTLLKRGSWAALVARREWGGMLVQASRLLTSFSDQTALFRQIVNLDYSDARRHMKLWMFWSRIENTLRDRAASCHQRGLPFIVPGYRRCLSLAGITKHAERPTYDRPPAPITRDPLPPDVELLTKMVEDLEQQNRMERAANARLMVELDLARDEIHELTFNRADPLPVDDQTSGIMGAFKGWLRRKRIPVQDHPDREIEIRTGDCLALIEQEPNVYDSIVTDPPYGIALHGYAWDNDITFSHDLWKRLLTVLKPGGYIACFAAPRLYHRAAQAAEQAGFTLLPFLAWRFREGLPKPINLSELFDRDNLADREVVGQRRGSGFTQANVMHGGQNRTHTIFTALARHVSEEAQRWRGFYYGRNALKPCLEPILLAQKPIQTSRMIDNIRQWGTGALNIGALQEQYGFWPSTLLVHRKTSRAEHQSDHPSVKPLTLMEDICTLVTPKGGRILDPFAGTGTTGVAAQRRGFDCVLIEQNQMMRKVIEDRLHRSA